MKEFAMKCLLPAFLAILSVSALAQEPEPPLESHPIGTIVFIVLFVGFCVVFAWMVWRNKDKEKKRD
jgi:membrane protein DedA with SNARE-associated domain